MNGYPSIWVHATVVVLVVVIICGLLFLNHIYRSRRRKILYRLATGKTALEGPKDDDVETPVETEHTTADNETKDEPEAAVDNVADARKAQLDAVREKLWVRMEEYMKEKTPFVDPDFDRNVLAKDMFSNISYVSGAINAHGKSFTTWLAEYRVKMAIDILHQQPKIAVRDLCVKVGVLNPVVFNRQFRGVTGMSVSEFRSQIGK